MRKKLTVKEVETRWPDFVKGQKWISNREKYKFSCSKHGEYLQFYTNHCAGKKCSKCRNDKLSEDRFLSIEEAERRYSDMTKGQQWRGVNARYRFLCLKHGEYLQTFHSHKIGSCPICTGRVKRIKLTIEEAERRYPDLVKGQKWVRAISKYWFLCPTHGKYLQIYNGQDAGQRCPFCSRSIGEEVLEKTLLNLGISDYKKQRRFDGCRNSYPLPFDGVSESLKTLFEYHGRQHYEAVVCFGGEDTFKQRLLHDKIKKDWAKKNGWKLIVIPYMIKNIESYIKRRLAA